MLNSIDVGTAVVNLMLDDTGFNSALNGATSAIQNFQNQAGSGMSSLQKVSQLTGDIGLSMTRNITVPVVKGAESIVSAFASTESAFTGVRKTLDKEELETQFGSLEKAYESLDNAIWQMTQETGSSYEAIAAVMEMAGQLNVPIGTAGKSLIDFTKNIIMLNDTTDLLGADAAKDLAQFMNIMGTSFDDVNNLGAAIVDLGNNSATTEAAIVAMAMRLAGAGNSLGLTEQEVLAIAATLTSVGISAEMGGSAFTKAMKKMSDSSVVYDKIITLQEETGMSLDELNILAQNDSKSFKSLADSIGMGSSDMQKMIKTGLQLQGFAEVSNMSMQEFAETMRNEPIKAIESFVIGLGDTEGAGKSTVEMLQEMGFTEVRLSDTLTRMSLSQGELTRELKLANDAWGEGKALQDEADDRYKDLAVKISQLREQWKHLEVDLAELIVPVLKEMLDVISRLISGFQSLPDGVKKFLLEAAGIAAVIGPILLIVSKITGAVSNLFTFLGLLKNFGLIKKIGDVAKGLGEGKGIAGILQTIIGVIKTVIGAIGQIFTALAPIASFLAGIGIAVTNFIDMMVNGVNGANAAWTILGTTLVGIGLFLMGLISPIGIVIAALIGGVMVAVAAIHEHWDEIVDWFKKLWDGVSEWWEGLWEGIKKIASGVAEGIRKAWDGFVEFWQGIGDSISKIWDTVWGFVQDIVQGFVDWIEPIFDGVVTTIEDAWDGFVTFFSDLWETITTVVSDAFDTISGVLHDIWDAVTTTISDVVGAVADKLAEIWENVTGFFSDVWDSITGFFSDLWRELTDRFDEIGRNVSDFVDGVWKTVSEWFDDVIRGVGEFFGDLVRDIIDWFRELRENIDEAFRAVAEVVQGVIDTIVDAFETFVDFISGVIEDIQKTIDDVVTAIQGFVEDAATAIGEFFSNIFGAIEDLWTNLTTFISDVWESITKFLSDAFSSLWKWISGLPDKFVEIGEGIINSLWDGLKSVWENVQKWFEEKFGWVSDLIEKIKGVTGGIVDKVSDMLPGHANGLDYVPYDNYVARLHKGERVLTREENQEYNRNGGVGGDTFNFYNTQPDPYEYARQMKRVKKELLLT